MHKIRLLSVIFVLWLASNSFAQTNSDKITKEDSIALCEKQCHQLDIVDLWWKIIKKPVVEKCEPSKQAWKFHPSVLPAFGYSSATGWAGVIATNLGFYTDNGVDSKLSAIDASIAYTQKNQIILPILSNIWTRGNKVNLLGDWRLYKFPEYTYGLGGHTTMQNYTQLNYQCIIIHEAVLKHISTSNFYVGLAYNLNYHWNISEYGYSNNIITDFQKYGRGTSSVSSGISVNALYDGRKNSINPSKAFYSGISFCPFLSVLGSDKNYNSLIIDVRKYFKPGAKSDNILAFWTYNWFTFNGNAPYLDLPSTGWDPYANVGRGYIQSRLRSKNLIYLEAEYRFAILKNGLLGGVVFTNAQSVTDWPNNKFNTIYPAVGAGIRIKINKYSAANLAIDYAFGIGGSNGVFINLGEVF
jgi:hypothetical protein